jgi:hypothetical protein
MGIANRAISRKTIRVVYTADEDVTPNDPKAMGWIPLADATTRHGASIVEIRPLDVDQRAHCEDGGGAYTIALRWCRSGIASVNGDKKAEAVEEFIENIDFRAIRLGLGCYIDDVSNGDDTAPRQESCFRGLEAAIAQLERRQEEPAGAADGAEAEE